MDEDRVNARAKLEEECKQLSLRLTHGMKEEKKQKAGFNQRMMIEQFDRLLLRHSMLEKIEKDLFNFDIEKINVSLLQRQYVNEVEGIAQHTYAVLAHYIKWIKSILPHPEGNIIKDSVSKLIESCDKNNTLDKYWKSVLQAEYHFRAKYVDHPMSTYTWHTESLLDQRTYVHYHDVAKRTSFTPPHPDLVINAVMGLIKTHVEMYSKVKRQ